MGKKTLSEVLKTLEKEKKDHFPKKNRSELTFAGHVYPIDGERWKFPSVFTIDSIFPLKISLNPLWRYIFIVGSLCSVGSAAVILTLLVHNAAMRKYRTNREKGLDYDNPEWKFPNDGTYERVDLFKMRYIEGLGDKKWRKEKKKNFLRRLQQEEDLREKQRKEIEKKQFKMKNGSEKITPKVLKKWVQEKLNEKLSIDMLDLSYQGIDDDFARDVLKPCLENYFPSLKIMDIKGNRISFLGAKLLAIGLEKTKIEKIDLRENYIYSDKEKFKDLETHFKKCQQLKTIHFGKNFLTNECKMLFKKTSNSNNSYCYGFFKTKPNNFTKSLMNDKYGVTHKKWLVSLVCPKKREHAIIYLEGMNKLGQRFLERYHISAAYVISIAKVEVDTIKPKEFDPNKYYIANPREIDSKIGKELKTNIEKQKKEIIPYSITGGGSISSKKRKNCLQWCCEQLKDVGVEFEPSIFGLPSFSAGADSNDTINGSCLIM